MKIVILGGGSIGGSVASELSSEDNDVFVIDNNEEIIAQLETKEGVSVIHGNASSPKVLESSSIDEKTLLLCLTDSEEVNLLSSIIAKTKFNAGSIICRLTGSTFADISKQIAPFVDYFINPEDLITEEIKHLLHHPGSLEILDFIDNRIKLVSVYAKPSGLLVGRQIRDLKEHLPDYETRIPAIYRDEELIIPTGDTVINEGDEVFFIADEKHIEDVTEELQKLESRYKDVFIAGCGNIGKSLAKKTFDDFNIKVIDKNAQRCEEAAEELENVLILNADAADKEFLTSENIDDCDVFVTVTQDDEINVLCSLMAKKMGVKKTITIINKEAYFDIVGKDDLDIIVSPVQITVSHILKYVRRGSIFNVHKVKKGKAEVIELSVDERISKIIGKTIADLDLDENISIPCIASGNEVKMAHGVSEIKEGDHLLIFYKDKEVFENFYNKYK